MTVAQEVLAEIDAFMVRHGVKPTALGRLAVQDPHVVRRLRQGRGINSTTIDQLRAFMRSYDSDRSGPKTRNAA